MTDFERRKVLKAGGAALTIGLAGCIGPFQDRQGVPGTVESDGSEENGGGGGHGGGEGEDGGGGDAQSQVDDHLSEVTNYDGTIEDFTGEDTVQVTNGDVEGTEQQFAFGPPAIRVDAGTTVVWEWSGSDAHSVTHADGAFDSGIQSGDGSTFEFTFEEAGTYLYYCVPHRALNQKGAVVVEG